jgi:hypothetical protein
VAVADAAPHRNLKVSGILYAVKKLLLQFIGGALRAEHYARVPKGRVERRDRHIAHYPAFTDRARQSPHFKKSLGIRHEREFTAKCPTTDFRKQIGFCLAFAIQTILPTVEAALMHRTFKRSVTPNELPGEGAKNEGFRSELDYVGVEKYLIQGQVLSA